MSLGLDPATIAALAPLIGTLTPGGGMTALEAQQQQELDAVHQQAAQAAQSAQQAQGQFQQAAQQAPPDANGFIQQLLGNFASTLGETPLYSQQAHQNVQSRQSDLMEARRNNLEALRTLFAQRAKAAEDAGDVEAATKARQQHEKLALTLEQLNKQADYQRTKDLEAQRVAAQTADREAQHVNRLSEIKATGEQARQTEAEKLKVIQGAKDEENAAIMRVNTKTTASGVPVTDLSQVPPASRVGVMKLIDQYNQAHPEAKGVGVGTAGMDHLAKIQIARDNIDSMLAQAQSILPANPTERITKYGERKLSKILQTKDDRNAWGTWRVGAIQSLIALAGGLGSGLRINQAEILQAVQNDIPTLDDTYSTALKKARNIKIMLAHTERPILEDDWRNFNSEPGSLPNAAPTVPATENPADPLGVLQ